MPGSIHEPMPTCVGHAACLFFFSSRRRHTRFDCDWSSDVCSSDLLFERRVVISGVGQSAIGRQVDRSGLALTIDAILAAVQDAGLGLDDIDGMAMFPGGGVANLPGYANGNLYEVQDALGITTTWRQGIVEGMSLPFYAPAMAVAYRHASAPILWRTGEEGNAGRKAGRPPAYRSTQTRVARPA